MEWFKTEVVCRADIESFREEIKNVQGVQNAHLVGPAGAKMGHTIRYYVERDSVWQDESTNFTDQN